MGFLNRILSVFWIQRTLENPSTPINDETLSGDFGQAARVDQNTVFSITMMWRAVNVLAGVLASMPIDVYQVMSDESTKKKRAHPVSTLIRLSPNPFLSRFDFIQTMVTHLIAYGNAYARIDRNVLARPVALTLLDPSKVSIDTSSRRNLVYEYINADGQKARYGHDRILHFSGLSKDGLKGIDIIKEFRKVLEAGINNQEYIAAFYANGAHLSGAVSVPTSLTNDAYERLRRSWKSTYGGPKRAGETAILEAGATYQKIGLSPADAGFMDTRRAIVADISRITGVPQFLLEDLERSTFNNIEHLSGLFVNYTVMPLCANLEAELTRKLLYAEELHNHEIRFDVKYLLRADSAGRSRLIDTQMKWGIINRDEARAMEGLNPIPGGSGKVFYIPMNMRDPEKPENQPPNSINPPDFQEDNQNEDENV